MTALYVAEANLSLLNRLHINTAQRKTILEYVRKYNIKHNINPNPF